MYEGSMVNIEKILKILKSCLRPLTIHSRIVHGPISIAYHPLYDPYRHTTIAYDPLYDYCRPITTTYDSLQDRSRHTATAYDSLSDNSRPIAICGTLYLLYKLHGNSLLGIFYCLNR